jgi:predicted MPP superfamily phosphohydrolase
LSADDRLAIFKKKLTRRSFLKYGFRLSVLSFLGFGFAGRNNLITEHHTLEFYNLPEAFNGFRIVQISDLHASFWVGRGYLDQVVKRVNSLPKDLLVITGDFITGSVNNFWKRWLPSAGGDYIETVIEVLSRLEKGTKLSVLGNHDQWDGKETECRLVSELERIGIGVLRNQSQTITRGQEKISIAGTDDIWFSYNIGRALQDVRPEGFTVVLSHSPDVREDLGPPAKVELVLCGHTHGGQVAIPYLSHYFIPIQNPARYLSGLVKEPYGYTYVNRGIGTLVFPLRIGAPPEITYIRLVQA